MEEAFSLEPFGGVWSFSSRGGSISATAPGTLEPGSDLVDPGRGFLAGRKSKVVFFWGGL